MVKVLSHVIRNVNELNIPPGNLHGFEILYFGVNLILMFDYRLSFCIEVKGSQSCTDEIEVLIISRKDVSTWVDSARGADNNSIKSPRTVMHYKNNGHKINDIFIPSISDAYAFILSNRSSPKNIHEVNPKAVKVILTHSWQQEIKESQLKNKS